MTFLNHSNNLCLVTLQCSSTSASGSGDYYCKSQEDEIQKAKEAVKNAKDNSDDKSKKEKELKKLQSGLEEHIAKDHPLDESTRSNKIKEVDDQKKFVEKFQNDINNALNDGSNNILTHLCDGLQKFLGFDSTSKGYDGTGIVYSDLDRLCDAVMGFLLKCLQGSETLLTHYNTDIPRIIQELKSSIGKGLGVSGFAQAIEQVRRGLQGYEGELRDKAQNIINGVNTIKTRVITYKSHTNSREFLTHSLTNQLNDIRIRSQHISDSTELLGSDADKLDDGLKRKLTMSVESVKQAVKTFKDVVENKGVGDQAAGVGRHLKLQKRSIDHAIDAGISRFRKKLKKEFLEIGNSISSLNSQKDQHFTVVKQALSLARRDVGDWLENFNDFYKDVIINHFNEVRAKINDIEPRDSSGGKHSDLKNEVLEIQTQVSAMDAACKKKLKDIWRHVTENVEKTNSMLQPLLENADTKVEKAYRKVVDLVDAATSAFSELDVQLQKDLDKMKKDISGPLSHLKHSADVFIDKFNKTKTAIEAAVGRVEEDMKKFKDLRNIAQIDASLEAKTTLLQHVGGGNTFQTLTTYFTDLDSAIMSPLKTAIKGIGGGMLKRYVDYFGPSDFPTEIKKINIEKSLIELQNALSSKVPDLNTVKIGGINIEGLENMSLKSKLIGVAPTIQKATLSDVITDKSDANQIYSELADIAKAVSEHSQQVVGKVMEMIPQKVTTEIGEVAGKLEEKMKTMLKALKDETQNNDVQYMESGDKVAGLGRLGDIFKKNIKKKLEDLENNVIDVIFKRTGWDVTIAVDQTLTNYAGDNGKKKLKQQITEIKTAEEIRDLSAFHVDQGLSIKTAIDAIQRIYADDFYGENEIRTRTVSGYDTAQQRYDAAFNLVMKKIHQLEGVPSAIDVAQAAVADLLEQLRTRIEEIQNKIKIVGHRVDEASLQLQSSIHDLTNSCNKAEQKSNAAITEFNNQLTNTVSSAFSALTNQVQSLFAKQKQAELSALESVVTAQLAEIERVIENEKDSGLKGFIKRLNSGITHNFDRSVLTDNTTFAELAVRLSGYVDPLFEFINEELTPLNSRSAMSAKSQPADRNATKVDTIRSTLATLLTHLKINKTKTYNFDNIFTSHLDALEQSVGALSANKFGDGTQPELLNVVRAGVQAFHGELAKQYVSRYSGEIYAGQLVKDKQSPDVKSVKSPAKPGDDTEITEYGRKCAKVFLTSLGILLNDFTDLKQSCKDAALLRIFAPTEGNKNALADFFSTHGFTIAKSFKTQEGEVNNKEQFTGTYIYKDKLTNGIFNVSNITFLQEWATERKKKGKLASTNADNMSLLDILHFLYDQLEKYYTVSHLRHIERPRSPSSVYQMLVWLTGLPHNRVFQKVSVGDIGDLFEKPDEDSGDGNHENPPILDNDPDTVEAYPQAIAASSLTSTIQNVCVDAEDVLIGILGHGHADGIYAVDFNTNQDGFSYPTAPGACFDMLCDILHRLYQQLYFLYSQCSNDESSAGWLNCWYGNQVGGSNWKCNAMQCPNQKGNQIHKQKCNQNCNQITECGIKSPLQSFLEDGLPGFLPHSFTKPGCKLECTYSNHRGIPCRTPMGFTDISVAASHRQTGEYLRKVLHDFCGSESAALTKLCGQLTCLLQKPPQTLGDIFAFYYGYLEEWANDFYDKPRKPNPYTQVAFNDAVNAAIFGMPYDALNPKILVSSSKHDNAHTNGNLCSIANCKSGSLKPCGLYVKSMTQEISKYYSAEHKGNHLSWIVYITETFCDLLKKLYDDCCKKCGPAGSKCHTKSCDENCQVKYTDSTGKPTTLSPTHNHSTYCKSIVTCRDTHPTLYRYGFTFGHPWGLNGSGNNEGAKRTCKDFCEALKLMVGEKSVLITLRGQIDQFLWAIRLNFSITVLALWLLSLFYLLHIMVIRLDLLHIKSHLHSPSSHRIAAQSLLAAARVNKLNRVFYLQP